MKNRSRSKQPIRWPRKSDEEETGENIPVSILVVEDNEVVRKLLLQQLIRLGFAGKAVTNGKEAVQAFFHDGCQLVLMDVSMPVMGGLEATRLIREAEQEQKRVHTPIVAVTAVSDRETCLQAGMDDFLTKPFLIEHLRSVLARWLTLPVV
jgi:CheY-like chemotaxis protein